MVISVKSKQQWDKQPKILFNLFTHIHFTLASTLTSYSKSEDEKKNVLKCSKAIVHLRLDRNNTKKKDACSMFEWCDCISLL